MRQAAGQSSFQLPSRTRVLIVEARFYEGLTEELVAGAQAVLEAAKVTFERVTVPGALEIPGVIALASEDSSYSGYVALGVVIRGETSHYEIVSQESARGLVQLTLDGICIGNGIVTVENEAQAWERVRRNELDKGGAAARACLTLISLRRQFQEAAR